MLKARIGSIMWQGWKVENIQELRIELEEIPVKGEREQDEQVEHYTITQA